MNDLQEIRCINCGRFLFAFSQIKKGIIRIKCKNCKEHFLIHFTKSGVKFQIYLENTIDK